MKNELYAYILAVHIAGGFSALLAGAILLSIQKGTPAHKKWGLIYYYGMAIVFFTTISMCTLRPENRNLWFLTAVAISSFYQAYTGRRRLRTRPSSTASTTDLLFLMLISVSALACAAAGIWFLTAEATFIGALFLFFALISAQAAVEDIRLFFTRKACKQALSLHISRMTGAYAATVTAFVVNAVPKYLPAETPMLVFLLLWIVPGTLIGFLGSRFAQKFKIQVK